MTIREFFLGSSKKKNTDLPPITCADVIEAAQDLALRDLAFQSCVNMISAAIGRCEFRTFKANQEVRQYEYYMLNVEPNVNQNSTAFWHKVIQKLYTQNEALIISTTMRDGRECLVCADSFEFIGDYPQKMNEYKSVVVGQVTYNKTFKENTVLHLKLNEVNIRPILDALYASFLHLIEAANAYYIYQNGTHMKVHVSQIAQGTEDFQARFQDYLSKTVMPFIKSENGILPEFDGYEYTTLGGNGGATSDDGRKLFEDVFNFTARGLLIPVVLVNGTVEGTEDANKRFLTYVVDPLCDQIQEELVRKRYGYDAWKNGDYVKMDSSSILHFDVFENAANIEKVVGSAVFSVNDVLRAANQAPIPEPWADKHYMTLNISNIGGQTTERG